MIPIKKKQQVNTLLVCITLLAFGQASASTLDKSAHLEQTIIREAQQSQKVINKSTDKAWQLKNEIADLQAEIKGLKVYQQHLSTLLSSQQQELSSLDKQQSEIADTRQSVVPLMYEMLTGLSAYIAQDMPIRRQDRVTRVEKLQLLMSQSDISDAEKYRRIVEAYQIELDYVTKLGTYTSPIVIDGVERTTEQLYLGHLSFLARTIDKQRYWVWQSKTANWQQLDQQFNAQLDNAFLIATKQHSPALLMLPLSQQEALQ